MRTLQVAANWVRQLFRSRTFEREMRAEMQAHIEQEAALLRARGMSTGESYAAAKRDFGNVGYLQEQSRDARGTRFIEETKRDLVYGVRALLRTPGFTTVAILSLALGIGVNTAMFTLGRFAFAPPQLSQPETFASIRTYITYPTWQALASEPHLFSKTVVHASLPVAVSRSDASAAAARMELVSDGYFAMYRGRAHLGRLLGTGEAQSNEGVTPVVLSFPFWRTQFAEDSNVIGRTVRLTNGLQLFVVGIANSQFVGAGRRVPDMFAPITTRPLLPNYSSDTNTAQHYFSSPKDQWLSFAGQLEDGTPPQQARLHLKNLLAHLPTADSSLLASDPERFELGPRGYVSKSNAAGVGLALSATMMVLLIGCANVANLVLARGVKRRREIAVRLSLGATRLRLIRQLMTENAILAIAGGATALALSMVVMRLLSASDLMSLYKADPEGLAQALRPDTYIVTFTFVMAFVSATASGLLPALRSTKMDLSGATRDDGAAVGNKLARSRLRSALVVAQVSFSLVLLITASVLLRSAENAGSMDLGYDRDNLIVTSISRSENGYTNSQHVEFGKRLQERAEQMVGAERVTRGTIPTLVQDWPRVNPVLPGRRVTGLAKVSATYFKVMGIPIVRGRAFTEIETRNAVPVAVVSEATANRYWPTAEAIGQRLVLARETYRGTADSLVDKREVVVVGIAGNAQMIGVGRIPEAMMYEPADTGAVLIRATTSPEVLVKTLRQAALSTDRNVLASVRTMNDLISENSRVQSASVTSTYTSILGTLGLLLSALGIFGVVAYAVSQRTREIGVRLAIGAQQSDVFKLVLRQGMRPVIWGLLLGFGGAALMTRALRLMLFGVTGTDPVAYFSAGAVVCVVAVLACYFPARRAMSVDPVSALRAE